MIHILAQYIEKYIGYGMAALAIMGLCALCIAILMWRPEKNNSLSKIQKALKNRRKKERS